MKDRLNLKNITYYYTIWIMYHVLEYYGKLFQILPKSPIEIAGGMYPYTYITEKNGITKIHLHCEKVQNSSRGNYTVIHIKEILNDYMQYYMQCQTYVKPFHNGKSAYDIIESLYVDMVYEDKQFIYFDVIYIDNPIAYNYVIEDRKVRFYDI